MTISHHAGAGQAAEAALRLRYGESGPAGPWTPVIDQLVGHRSVRAYRPDPLPAGTLESLIAAAQSAATSSNLQAWSVVAVEDPDRKQRLSVLAGDQKHIRDCPLFLVWLADLARIRRIAEDREAPALGLDYLEMLLVAVIDAALAAQNAVVALESLGLGGVYIGGIRNRPEQVAAELGLPPGTVGVFGLCVGYPDPAHPAAVKPRLPQAAVLHRETYSLAAQTDAITAYDQHMAAFQTSQAMKPAGWTRQTVNRVRGPDALSGRDRLAEALRTLGFGLA